VDGAGAFSYPLIFLPFISSAFVPTATMPGPVRAFAENQPVTPIVNAIRDLFTQQPVGTDIWIALACRRALSRRISGWDRSLTRPARRASQSRKSRRARLEGHLRRQHLPEVSGDARWVGRL
jgi:hypothetical protein